MAGEDKKEVICNFEGSNNLGAEIELSTKAPRVT